MIKKALMALAFASLNAVAATPNEILATYTTQAGQPAVPARGETLFKSSHGQEWKCTSCHTSNPMQSGNHASTDKIIAPLAPVANVKRFTDLAKSDKWFRRNCKDVMNRECTASEKADVLAWLLTLK